MSIHSTAVIDTKAELDSSVVVGAYAVIEAGVRLGAGTEVQAHSYISGPTTIGTNNLIGAFTTIGAAPQDISYKGEPTELIIGDNNQIREYASIHRGTLHGSGKTVIGDNNLLMAYTHVAHDCKLGNYVIMANSVTLAGHVEIGDYANIGGIVGVHQFCRIGAHSYVGGLSGVTSDVPPYVIMSGIRSRTRISGINKIGLRRHGFSKETINRINEAFRIIFRSSDLLHKDAMAQVKKEITGCEAVDYMIRFFEDSKRGVMKRTIDD